MLIKLRRTIIGAGFSAVRPAQAAPEEILAGQQTWAAAAASAAKLHWPASDEFSFVARSVLVDGSREVVDLACDQETIAPRRRPLMPNTN